MEKGNFAGWTTAAAQFQKTRFRRNVDHQLNPRGDGVS